MNCGRRVLKEVACWTLTQRLPLPPPPPPFSVLRLPLSMAIKVDEPTTTYVERPVGSTSDSFDLLTPPTLTPEEEAKVWRKVDIRLVPIVSLLYLFSFLDRGTSHKLSIVFWPVSDPAS